jgi:hypothetical protein
MNAGPAFARYASYGAALATPVAAFRRGEPLALMPYAFVR